MTKKEIQLVAAAVADLLDGVWKQGANANGQAGFNLLQYEGMRRLIGVMGGSYTRDEKGRHKVSLFGAPSIGADEFRVLMR